MEFLNNMPKMFQALLVALVLLVAGVVAYLAVTDPDARAWFGTQVEKGIDKRLDGRTE